MLAQARVKDTIAKFTAPNQAWSFDVLRMAPPRRLESYKQLFKKLLELSEQSGGWRMTDFGANRAEISAEQAEISAERSTYSDLVDVNESLDRLLADIFGAKKKVGFVHTATASQADLDKVRGLQRERAERLAIEADGPPPSYQPEPSTSQRIVAERDRTKRAYQTVTDEARVQRIQELELRSVMEEVVAMGYDRDLVERIQMTEKHGSPVVSTHNPRRRVCFPKNITDCYRNPPPSSLHALE